MVYFGRCALDGAERADDRLRHALLADAEIAARTLGLRAPIAVGRHLERAARIALDARFDHGFSEDGQRGMDDRKSPRLSSVICQSSISSESGQAVQPAWQRRDGQPFPGLFLTGLSHIEIPRIIADCSRVGWALDFPTRSLVPQVLLRLKQRACPGSVRLRVHWPKVCDCRPRLQWLQRHRVNRP
jgi:hypothetical protein